MTQKTWEELAEEQNLHEFRILRAGAILAYAGQVRNHGKKVESDMRSAQSELGKIKRAETPEEKLDILAAAMDDICSSIISERRMLGSLTGISVAAGLLAERTDKQLARLQKGKSRR